MSELSPTSRRFLLASLVAIPLALGAAPAHVVAQPGDEPARLAQAEDLYKKGVEAMKAGKKNEAYGYLHDAYAIKQSFDIAGNLGQIELLLGKYRDAAEHLSHSIRVSPANGKEEAKKKSAERLEQAKREIGTLAIRVNVAGATVAIDGAPLGASPLDGEVFVEPGPHTITASLEGYTSVTSTKDIAKGARAELALTLERAPAAGGAGGAGGAAALSGATSSSSGGDTGAGGSADFPPAKKPIWPYVVGGVVAAVGVGVGIGGVVSSASHGSNASDMAATVHSKGARCASETSAPCAPIQRELSSRDTLRGVGIAGFAVGGAALIATIVYAAVPARKRETAHSIQIAPSVGLTNGVLVRGSF